MPALSDRLDSASSPEYLEGQRAAIAAALDYGFAAIQGDRHPLPSVPIPILAQVRLAARSGVRLDSLIRRCFAGYTLFADFLVGEANAVGIQGGSDLRRLMRGQAVAFDALLTAVGEEHSREVKKRMRPAGEHRAERVQRLLAGELLDTTDLAYDIDSVHLGVVAEGRDAVDVIRKLAGMLDRRLLLVRREGMVWAWLGGSRRFDASDLERLDSKIWPNKATLAIGEPGEEIDGWRRTHRQALAALPVALRADARFVRYRDVPLLAAALQDALLSSSLRVLYREPLEREPNHGQVAKDTLRAYFAAGRNISSAAAGLSVSRQAVGNRLRSIERRLGRPVDQCAAELELALKLERIEGRGAHQIADPREQDD
jgi:nitroreductase